MAQTGRQHCNLHVAWKSFTPILLYNTGPRARDSEMKTVRTPRRRATPPAAERDGRDPRGRLKLHPVPALQQGQRHVFCHRTRTLGYFATRRNIRLRRIITENETVSAEPWQRADRSAQQTSLDKPETLWAASLGRVEARIVRPHPRPGYWRRHPLQPLRPERRAAWPWLWPASGRTAYRIRTAPRASTCGVACMPPVGPAPASQGWRRGG